MLSRGADRFRYYFYLSALCMAVTFSLISQDYSLEFVGAKPSHLGLHCVIDPIIKVDRFPILEHFV